MLMIILHTSRSNGKIQIAFITYSLPTGQRQRYFVGKHADQPTSIVGQDISRDITREDIRDFECFVLPAN
jgi:hypothetical protein